MAVAKDSKVLSRFGWEHYYVRFLLLLVRHLLLLAMHLFLIASCSYYAHSDDTRSSKSRHTMRVKRANEQTRNERNKRSAVPAKERKSGTGVAPPLGH